MLCEWTVSRRLTIFILTRKYPLRRHVPSPSWAGKEDNVEERENSEANFFLTTVRELKVCRAI